MVATQVNGTALPGARRWSQYSLRSILLATLVAAMGLGIYCHFEQQRQRVWHALGAICHKGVDMNVLNPSHVVVNFKNGNVTDEDLERFIPALATKTPTGHIMELRLNNSNVSEEAVAQLKRMVPECTVVR